MTTNNDGAGDREFRRWSTRCGQAAVRVGLVRVVAVRNGEVVYAFTDLMDRIGEAAAVALLENEMRRRWGAAAVIRLPDRTEGSM